MTFVKGHTFSPETLEKLRRAKLGTAFHRGYKHSAATKAKMRAAKLGRKLSLETRQKMAASRSGRNHWNGRTLCVPCHKNTPTYGFQKGYTPWNKKVVQNFN